MSKKTEESISFMEPMLPEIGHADLGDLCIDLVGKASAFAGKLNPVVRQSVGHLVRSMNCYYSNLIEGHNTHPRDIDRALAENFSSEPEKRALQKEAVAHIEVQKIIDAAHDPQCSPLSKEYVLWLHKEFCERLPEELLWVNNPDTGEKIKVNPGIMRDGMVVVGKHIPPYPENLDRFMERFNEAYTPEKLSKTTRILASAAAHHRLLWIHPFYDGNGRVARLMSYATLRRLGIGSELWSVARGLARNVGIYKKFLEAADEPRRGDLDGRGTLSHEALVNFCVFFLQTCLDQIDFMENLLGFKTLSERIRIYVEEEIAFKRLPKGSYALLREALLVGAFERGQAKELTGYKERMARVVLADLLKKGFLVSNGPRAPVRLGFPIDVVERWFPQLYPATE
jgi:Fic family protein